MVNLTFSTHKHNHQYHEGDFSCLLDKYCIHLIITCIFNPASRNIKQNMNIN